ncbi:aconitate hydratase [Natronogracilivirga saccharolytica]|uniref:Aconitate hydratase A n=1 Tax=Natronogracilivirga saccharolytica TaxID=2812953 RepID=A0A8J7UTG1_9BACT|nr:aconitate hydratase [Natronogracilivirga saccharolytica]MBP3192576.1 aconitate hydratase [Natronogracilivirga saccharolytica]
MSNDIFGIVKELKTPTGTHKYYSLPGLQNQGYDVDKLPFTIRILLENALRNYDDFAIKKDHIETLLSWSPDGVPKDIPYMPARVLMQDFTGVPSVVDIASIRSEVARKKGSKAASGINPQVPVDLIIDHSVQVDFFGTTDAYRKNVELEYERNQERYSLLKWAQQGFADYSVLPPGLGICHQVNLEYLAQGVYLRDGFAFPDTLVGTDSHTPMVNGIGVVGWGVGGIEAEAVMLGQPIYMLNPEVVGLKLTGSLPEGATSTDLVLAVTHFLRSHGVVGKFVEVFGDGLDTLTVPDRATISNMSPEFGCTVTFFPIDDRTLDYMQLTGRNSQHIETVEAYTRSNLMWRENENQIRYTEQLELDLGDVVPAISGPKRPQDKISLTDVKDSFVKIMKDSYQRDYIPYEDRERWLDEGGEFRSTRPGESPAEIPEETDVAVETKDVTSDGMKSVQVKTGDTEFMLSDGSVVIAAITSCTNTSNPSVMLGAGLVAKKAVDMGLDVKPWVKTSLAPGSKVVTRYYEKSGLLPYLEALGFHVVGYGCTTCIGNSGDLPPHIAKAVEENDMVVSSVLSGNRNFEARIHPSIKMNFLASPMLVVAYALAGRVDLDMINEPLGYGPNFEPVYMKDIWPTEAEIREIMETVITPEDFKENYATLFEGDDAWKALEAPTGKVYEWSDQSTYIKEAPFFLDIPGEPQPLDDIVDARTLLVLGDSITTDHISPAGKIGEDTPAGKYLISKGVKPQDFNSYGSRRGNHEVMIRGTFANVRIKNQLVDREGGWTIHHPSGEEMPVYDAAQKYAEEQTPLVVLGGKEYGSGSSRDWAAKGTNLLGVKAVIAESFERIHRSNLVGMGVLPLRFQPGESKESLGLKGDEEFTITGISEGLSPNKELDVTARKKDGNEISFKAVAQLNSEVEIAYYQNGGILQYVLRRFLKEV